METNRLTGLWIHEDKQAKVRERIAEFERGYDCGFQDASTDDKDLALMRAALLIGCLISFVAGVTIGGLF